MKNVLRVEGLKKSFRKHPFSFQKIEVLHGLDFEVKAGTVTGYLGANGAGKTTSLKCILNLAYPDDGRVIFFDDKTLSPEVRKRIGFLPERPYFYDYLTGREFLTFYGQLSDKIPRNQMAEKVDRLLDRVGLGHAKDRPLRGYSKGMLQRTGIAQALLHDPEFVILDEPMTGLDPDGRLEVTELIREVASSGTAVFFSSHLLHDVEKLCDNLVIMKKGNLVYQGATKEFLGQVKEGFQICFVDNDGHMKIEKIPSIDKVQIRLDELRKSNFSVIEVKQNTLSLEEAFVKVAFGESGQ